MKSALFSTIALTLGSVLLSAPTAAVVLDQCTLSLATLVSDPGLNSCLPMEQLNLFMTSNITAQLVDQTAAKFCAAPTCPASSITLVQNTVKQNCVNSTDPGTASLVAGAASLYDPAKEGLCSKATNGTFCVTIMAENLISYLTKNPSPLGMKIVSDPVALKQYVNQMPKDLLCTPCNKAMINPLNNYVTKNAAKLGDEITKWSKVVQTEVGAKCGADFVNGAPPTQTPNPSGSNGQSMAALSAESSMVAAALSAFFATAALL
ncbi:hypothetical protein BGX34_003060 [Mortierella sp. NVP85]|nr:hypothetical protein BGX34_003060 [Mortierella sp. NVP85]